MEAVMITALIMLHVTTGCGAVLGMFSALAAAKGGARHKFFGRIYTFSMALALIFALLVSALTSNFFLFPIALFSAYLVYTGWRLVTTKNGDRSWLDALLSKLMLLCALTMMGFGGYKFFIGESLGIVLAVFGVLAFLPAWADLKNGSVWPRGKSRIVLHLDRMGGACIATLTAIFLVNVKTDPQFIAWLLPTLIGAPVIVYWSKRTLSEFTAVDKD